MAAPWACQHWLTFAAVDHIGHTGTSALEIMQEICAHGLPSFLPKLGQGKSPAWGGSWGYMQTTAPLDNIQHLLLCHRLGTRLSTLSTLGVGVLRDPSMQDGGSTYGQRPPRHSAFKKAGANGHQWHWLERNG